jgi:hypothetical protein
MGADVGVVNNVGKVVGPKLSLKPSMSAFCSGMNSTARRCLDNRFSGQKMSTSNLALIS